MDNVILMKNVRKDFQEVRALKDLTFSVQEGEVFGFLGPSGAGKTTTIKLLTAQLLQSHGEIKVFGQDVMGNKRYLFANIGVLTDNSGIYERLTVWDNMMLFANLFGVSKSRVEEVLERVELLGSANTAAGKLSKGMRQRLMLARAVQHKPKLLFLDEPTSSLDPGTTQEIHKLLRQLKAEGTTIFLTTHRMEEADKLCDRVAFLNAGEIVEMGNPSDLKLKYITDELAVVLRDGTNKTIKNRPDSAVQIKDWMEKGQLLSIHSMEPSLEKIFLNLTGREL